MAIGQLCAVVLNVVDESLACLRFSDDDGGFEASLSYDSTQMRIGRLDEPAARVW